MKYSEVILLLPVACFVLLFGLVLCFLVCSLDCLILLLKGLLYLEAKHTVVLKELSLKQNAQCIKAFYYHSRDWVQVGSDIFGPSKTVVIGSPCKSSLQA